MKDVKYSVQEGGGCKPPEWMQPTELERSYFWDNRWLRVCRYTTEDDGSVVRELACFGMRGDRFTVRWKKFKQAEALTNVAPTSQFCIMVEE